MIACTITVGGITYAGLFHSTTAAVIDAMTRYPAALAQLGRAGLLDVHAGGVGLAERHAVGGLWGAAGHVNGPRAA